MTTNSRSVDSLLDPYRDRYGADASSLPFENGQQFLHLLSRHCLIYKVVSNRHRQNWNRGSRHAVFHRSGNVKTAL